MTYDALDAAILKTIQGGTRHFYLINAAVEGMVSGHRGGSFRIVDRRLQALRKRGLIEFKNKTWRTT